MTLQQVLEQLPAAFDANAAHGADCIVQLNASTPAHLVIAAGRCQVVPGRAAAPDVTLTMSDDDLARLFSGRLDGTAVFASGALQLDGDVLLAQRLMSFFDPAKLRG